MATLFNAAKVIIVRFSYKWFFNMQQFRRIQQQVLGGLILMVLAMGCSVSDNNRPILVPDIEDEFYLRLCESFSSTEKGVNLHIETIENDTCLNGIVLADIQQELGVYNLLIDGVASAQECESGSAPFVSILQLGSLPNGIYFINANLQNTIFNTGALTVTDTKYILSVENSKGIVVKHEVLNKIPDNIIWGSLLFTDPEEQNEINNLQQMIADTGIFHDLPAGYYGHFSIDDDDVALHPTISFSNNKPYQRDFVFKFTGDWNTLVTLANELRLDYPNMDLHFFNTKGNTYP